LKKRIISALVLAPSLILLVFFFKKIGLWAILLATTLLAHWELFKLIMGVSPYFLVFLSSLPFIGALWGVWGFLVGCGIALLFAFLYAFRVPSFDEALKRVLLFAFGLFYVNFPLFHFFQISELPDGFLWLLGLTLSIWCGDSFALFVGKAFGRRPLAPRISPKKTVEGGLATFLGVGLGFWLLKLLFLPRISWTIFVFIVLGVGFLSQVGDLSESLIKRASGVKDSGSLIPGHGGILDRMDSFIFASPFLYYLLRFS
jgi:phosphatidate cytidylyltransferase